MGRAMVDFYCAGFRQVPKRIMLDIDDTFDAVHGEQQLRLRKTHPMPDPQPAKNSTGHTLWLSLR